MSKPEFSAVDYATPVCPLVGRTEHCVRGGETPGEQIRAASYAYWRQQGRTASAALVLMRADVAEGTLRFPRHYPDANKSFAAYGEDRLRWIENPQALGLRLVGLAHDLYPHITHRGWFLRPDGCYDDVACGVVYQMSGKDGRARYLAGCADAWNCDETGRGSALLCFAPMVGERLTWFEDRDCHLGAIAQRADRIAERLAEAERAYNEAHEAGYTARQAGREMRKFAARYTAALRAFRAVFRNRHGIAVADACQILKVLAAQVRQLLAALKKARDLFRDGLDTRHDRSWVDVNAWRNGYANG